MKRRIRQKALLAPTILLVLAVVANLAVTSVLFRRAYAQALESRVKAIAENLRLQVQRLLQLGIPLNDIEGYNQQCKEVIRQHPDLAFAAIIDLKGQVLYHSDPSRVGQYLPVKEGTPPAFSAKTIQDPNLQDVRVPVMDRSGVHCGYAVVGFDQALIRTRINTLAIRTTLVAAVSVPLALVSLAWILSRQVVRPLVRLTAQVQAISQDQRFDQQVPVESDDEIGQLASSFNGLLEALRVRDAQIQDQLQQLRQAREELEERVRERTAELEAANASLREEIRRREEAEKQRERIHAQLMEASRRAGMADIATGVLHNVGNVLNSVNVVAALTKERLEKNRLASLQRAVEILQSHREHLTEYVNQDPQGQQLLEFFTKLTQALQIERQQLLEQIEELVRHVNHIKEIVAMQQAMARVAGTIERFDVAEVVEDALKINLAGLERHDVTVERRYEKGRFIVESDRHKVLQVLVNLISNAKYALSESGRSDRLLIIEIDQPAAELVEIRVRDNGIGIRPEHMPRLFTHGFTTRKEGHGFGLHASALAAKEIGGRLWAHSDGPMQGATFFFQIPVHPPQKMTWPKNAPINSLASS